MASDFHLPDEILAVIPTDPYEQLDIARKITSMAIGSRVSALEMETGRLRQRVEEKDMLIEELHDELSRLQGMFQDAEGRLSAATDENAKLCRERDTLTLSAKRLTKDLAKLESFKQQLMQSLSDEMPSHPAESADVGLYDQSSLKDSSWKGREGMLGYTASKYYTTSKDVGSTLYRAQSRLSITPYVTPRLTPTATPKVISAGTSPRGNSIAGSPRATSGSTSPVKVNTDEKISLSPWYPSSQQSSAVNSPPCGRPLSERAPRIDGKEFFRQARSRLSYEQFGAFLATIKEFNAHNQSREETLKKAEEIFGTDNKDLYLSFQGLLNRKP